MAEQNARGWLVREGEFSPESIRKYESILCQGNGYMGVRASLEESYERTSRCTLVAGTFDWAAHKNTTELPASADTTAVHLTADGIPLALTAENMESHGRSLDLRNGLLRRKFIWVPRPGLRLEIASERFVSLHDRHLLGQQFRVTVLEGQTELSLETGIRNDETPEKAHFRNNECLAEGDILQHTAMTHESGITFVTSAYVTVQMQTGDGEKTPVQMKQKQSPTQILTCCEPVLGKGQTLVMEKLCRIATSRDLDCETPGTLSQRELQAMDALKAKGYGGAFADSARCWETLWQQRDIVIDGPEKDQLAARFAVYHLTVMAPLHDNRMNIGAKGLSGKGYHGHTFWDTEIYMLPYFVWADPKGARSLLEYRHLSLDSARYMAKETGYAGARYPWEAAWITDGETCPEPGISDIEVHVTADVAYGVCYYYAVTHDTDFMRRYGCELLFETAEFWRSRLNRREDRYEILDVIGPDEFSRHVNNNAFTNYLVHMNLKAAVYWQDRLKREYPQDYARLNEQLDLDSRAPIWQMCADALVLPQPNEQNILPQDDTYLTLPKVDLTPYRTGERKLRQDYPAPLYSDIQVSKQADVTNLLLLLEDRFSMEVKQASFAYYEPLCVHESSLSMCAYAMLAAACGEREQAYQLFQKACDIDLGPNLKSSDAGIHAASLGGIWQCFTLGFCGIGMENGSLRIRPRLPDAWQSATVQIIWQGSRLQISVTHTQVTVQVLQGAKSLAIKTEQGLLVGEAILQWMI